MKKLIITSLLAIAGISSQAQNQFHISQYMMHQAFMNPAAIGSYSSLNAAMFYKKQWAGFEGAPTFQGFNISSPIKGNKNHLGFTFVNDQIGVNTNMDISALYAYKFKTSSKSRLVLSLGASARLIQSNYMELETDIANDPLFQQNSPLIVTPNFKFGAYFYTPKFYLGLAVPNLLKNSIAYDGSFSGQTEFDVNDMHFYLHSGYTINANENVDIVPSVLLKQVSGAPLQADVNVNAVFNKKFGVGFSYRSSKELAAMLSYQLIESLKLAYAYDFNFSELSNYSSGSHEIMLVFAQGAKKGQPIIEAPRY